MRVLSTRLFLALTAFSSIFPLSSLHAESAPLQAYNTPSPDFTLAMAQTDYSQGSGPAQAPLNGDWKLIGVVGTLNAPDIGDPDDYDAAGLKNGDKSDRDSLSFAAAGITFNGLGYDGMSQGANALSFSSQDVAFPEYTYDSSDFDASSKTGQSYFQNSCKLMANKIGGTQPMLICQITMHLDPSEISAADSDDVKFNGKIVAYHEYVKN